MTPTARDTLDLRAAPAVQYARMLGVMAVATAACFAFRSRLNPTDVAMVLLLGVVFVAARSGRGPSVAASVLGIVVFDFLFVPPYYTFTVAESSYFFTFAVMLVVALSMSRLTASIRDHAIEALRGRRPYGSALRPESRARGGGEPGRHRRDRHPAHRARRRRDRHHGADR